MAAPSPRWCNTIASRVRERYRRLVRLQLPFAMPFENVCNLFKKKIDYITFYI
jgi:hypothetical protein